MESPVEVNTHMKQDPKPENSFNELAFISAVNIGIQSKKDGLGVPVEEAFVEIRRKLSIAEE